uniref:Ferritin n=1 Tax=Calpodes ethlius TaxID=73634 RepID=Q9TVR3_CALET|nr:secreted ferritin S subunit precursor [Calpodes ethlius]AAD50239.1 secreted ferritin S subunit precursor [Calpodes ethlius]
MKSFLLTLLTTLALSASTFGTQCNVNPVTIPTDWITMTSGCRTSVRHQIQMEVAASLQYLAMGAHFSRDGINRPGFAKLFFDASSEERGHALKLIEYLLMRGELTSNISSLITIRPPERKSWESGQEALEHALRMETAVTKSIKNVIVNCEHDREANGRDDNDYHLVDYLTGEFLDEQYKGQRDLAGKAATLKKMMDRHSALGEFIFDKRLLGMDI